MYWLFCTIQLPHCKSDLWYTLEACFWVASFSLFLDADHFICSRSFSLQRARELPGRPFMHWFGLYAIIYGFLVLTSAICYLGLPWLITEFLPPLWVLFTALCSHVLRDAGHRGLWIWPPPNRSSWVGPPSGSRDTIETPPLHLFSLYICTIPLFAVPFQVTATLLRWKTSSFAPILRFLSARDAHTSSLHSFSPV